MYECNYIIPIFFKKNTLFCIRTTSKLVKSHYLQGCRHLPRDCCYCEAAGLSVFVNPFINTTNVRRRLRVPLAFTWHAQTAGSASGWSHALRMCVCVHCASKWPLVSPQSTDCVLFTRATLCYQLSLIEPRDKIVLYTELDDLCDKLQWSSVGARRYCQLS